ncbi:hypothetical protein GCM10022247_66130 [Allokutzneria multivorans]|uniref:Uncharacterized protein n=1 Tax=Allokutzneria multivorans TaxID=1142134 RepID=A0ABP7TVD1_9PSEU
MSRDRLPTSASVAMSTPSITGRNGSDGGSGEAGDTLRSTGSSLRQAKGGELITAGLYEAADRRRSRCGQH